MTNESQRIVEPASGESRSDESQTIRPLDDDGTIGDMPSVLEIGTPNLDPIDEPWSVVEIIRPEDSAK